MPVFLFQKKRSNPVATSIFYSDFYSFLDHWKNKKNGLKPKFQAIFWSE